MVIDIICAVVRLALQRSVELDLYSRSMLTLRSSISLHDNNKHIGESRHAPPIRFSEGESAYCSCFPSCGAYVQVAVCAATVLQVAVHPLCNFGDKETKTCIAPQAENCRALSIKPA